MRKAFWIALLAVVAFAWTPTARANERAYGFCTSGDQPIVVSGLSALPHALGSYASCTVTVYNSGTQTLATLYSDNIDTPLGNPFTATSQGYWEFYAASGRYDVTVSGGGLPSPFTYSDILLNDTSGDLNTDNIWTNNNRFKGPDPFVDISAYGVRPFFINNAWTTTGTIGASSSTLTVASSLIFQNGDGITISGAGSPISYSTPSAPTITPSMPSGPIGSADVVASPAGSTTRCYKTIWGDTGMGYTAASPYTCTSTGQATLGAQPQVPITSIARSGNTATVTTSSPHGLPVGCVATTCPEVLIWNVSDGSFDAFARLVTVPDTTHFTYVSPSSTAFGAASSATGGNVKAIFYSDHVDCGTVPASTAICYVYESATSGGTYSYVGNARMGETYYDYYGPTFSHDPLQPRWIPSTAPASAVADALTTTVSSGGGTTTLTLAAPATASVTSSYTTFDNCPQIKTAANDAVGNGGRVYIPPTNSNGKYYFLIGSYCAMPAGVHIDQAGGLYLTDTFQLTGGGNYWEGGRNGTQYSSTYVDHASPGIYLTSSYANSTINGVNFTDVAPNNNLTILSDQSTYDNVFNSATHIGNGSFNYTGIDWVQRGAGFENFFFNDGWFSSAGSDPTPLGDTTAPAMLFMNGIGNTYISYAQGDAKGIAFTNAEINGVTLTIYHAHFQGPMNPIVTTDANYAAGLEEDYVTIDTSSAPPVAGLNGPILSGSIILNNTIASQRDTGNYWPVVTGVHAANLHVDGLNSGVTIGQNYDVSFNQTSNIQTNGATGSGSTNGSITPVMRPQIVPNGANFPLAFEEIMAAPSLSAGAGGSVPTGSHTYTVSPIFPSGYEGATSPTASITISGGTQTVTATGVAVPGAVAYSFYRDSSHIGGCINISTLSCTDSSAATFGGTPANASYDGYPHLGSDGYRGPVSAANIDNILYVDGVKYTTIATACAALPSTGGKVVIPAGTNAPTAQIACPYPTWISGAGINETIIKPTAALAATLFAPSDTGVEGYKFSDLTIDMTNVPTIGVFDLTNILRPFLQNVRIIYPATTGTGTAIYLNGGGEAHIDNTIVKGAGYCWDIQGDAGAEDFFTDDVCEDPGTAGFRISRTTTTDVGGFYLKGVKITNPDNRTGSQAFVLTSTLPGTHLPFFCDQCIGDNIQGGHTFSATNVGTLSLTNSWFSNSALAASNYSGVALNTVVGFNISGGYIISNSRDFTLAGTDSSIRIASLLGGNATNLYVTGSTLSNVSLLGATLNSATPMSAPDYTSVLAAAPTGQGSIAPINWSNPTSGINSNAGTFAVSGNAWDFSAASHTSPVVTAATSAALPGSCTTGELGFVTGSTAGQNIWECNSGVWTQQLSSGSALSGMTAGQIPVAATANTVTSSKALQGTDTNILTSGTVSGTSAPLCTDASGGATTLSCPSPTGISGTTSGQVAIAGSSSTITSSKALQGTDSSIPTSGTISGTGSALCTDANGGITTASCTVVNGTTIPASVTLGQIVASGTSALGTSAISSGVCATAVTGTATGALSTDNLTADFNADPSSLTGYGVATTGQLTIYKWITANTVNFAICNSTGSSITPSAATLQWRVIR